jgi:hypothetical protein
MVVVDSDLERIDAVRVLVQGLDEPKVATADDLEARPLPRTVAVVHEGGPFGPIVVIAEAIAADNTVISRRAELSFVRARNVILKLHLDASCAGMTCTERGTTCIAGTCQSSKVEASELRDWSGSPDDHDAGPSGGRGGSNAVGGETAGARGGAGQGGPAAARSGGVPAAGKRRLGTERGQWRRSGESLHRVFIRVGYVRGELDVSAVATKAGAGSHLDCALGAGPAG